MVDGIGANTMDGMVCTGGSDGACVTPGERCFWPAAAPGRPSLLKAGGDGVREREAEEEQAVDPQEVTRQCPASRAF